MTAEAEEGEKGAVREPPSSLPPSQLVLNLRSCVVCRTRKVRCDKQSPCSNCRRAGIACTFASAKDRPPKWARRFENQQQRHSSNEPVTSSANNPTVDRLLERVRELEHLVRQLQGQLQEAHATTSSLSAASSVGFNSPGTCSTHDVHAEHQQEIPPNSRDNTSSIGNLHDRFGRLVVQDTDRSRYVSSGFWSLVNDEIVGFEMEETHEDEPISSDYEADPTQEPAHSRSERHAFLFGHNLTPSRCILRDFHPLPSQVPFLLDVFSENVNFIMQIVHIPTLSKMVRDSRGSSLTPPNEALMFSIYYATIISMEEDDVMSNFGSSKSDLSLKFRRGLEHALAKADFLYAPDIVLVQALAIFLSLVRRHDSPRFVWMMTGLVIRMALYLGLQRDGSHFPRLSAFEVEMRRRVWWTVCLLDMRASEDQGTELAIYRDSFDTQIPLNINDADISPSSAEVPEERVGLTDMSFPRIMILSYDIIKEIMAGIVVADPQDKSMLLDNIYQTYQRHYFQYTTESGNIVWWVANAVARITMAKMTLIAFLPVLFSSPNEHFSVEVRTKLLVSAIEVAEYNHALNSEQSCRHWRWIFQTYTHWHAIVYLLMEICRRPWSPLVERAWIALHSSWLIPTSASASTARNSHIWFPLRKLMAKARKHREDEVQRLRQNPHVAARLAVEDQAIPSPSSRAIESDGSDFRRWWRELVTFPEGLIADPVTHSHNQDNLAVDQTLHPASLGIDIPDAGQSQETMLTSNQEPALAYDPFPTQSTIDGNPSAPGLDPWLWVDNGVEADMLSNFAMNSGNTIMDLNGELDVDWYDWVEHMTK